MSDKEKCCPECAGNGVIQDYSGEQFVQKRPCGKCFETGFPPWMIARLLRQACLGQGAAEFFDKWKNRNANIPDATPFGVEFDPNTMHVKGGMVYLKKGKADGTVRDQAAGTDGNAHGGEQGQVPAGRGGTGSAGSADRERPAEPQDGSAGSVRDAAPTNSAATGFALSIRKFVRELRRELDLIEKAAVQSGGLK